MNRSVSNPIDPGSNDILAPKLFACVLTLTLTGKIGLLPKRPMSLVDTQAQSQLQSQQHQPPDDSDEEELEYIENPFEEGRHS